MDNETQRILQLLGELKKDVHHMDKRIEVGFAELPVHYITRKEYDEAKKELTVTRRWTMGTVVSIVALLAANWPLFG